MVTMMGLDYETGRVDQSSLSPHVAAMRVEVDTASCIGCGSCTAFAMRTFVINDELVAELTGEMDDADALLSAAESCPLYAIALFDLDGTKLYPKD